MIELPGRHCHQDGPCPVRKRNNMSIRSRWKLFAETHVFPPLQRPSRDCRLSSRVAWSEREVRRLCAQWIHGSRRAPTISTRRAIDLQQNNNHNQKPESLWEKHYKRPHHSIIDSSVGRREIGLVWKRRKQKQISSGTKIVTEEDTKQTLLVGYLIEAVLKHFIEVKWLIITGRHFACAPRQRDSPVLFQKEIADRPTRHWKLDQNKRRKEATLSSCSIRHTPPRPPPPTKNNQIISPTERGRKL